ncbi:LOW QUALITY PROTEIN: uncharacterized protein LOC130791715 [Actinidia eriantha]|uniref:LOW QUALITY PROTEIN: uncharacterized protein LOC130791715 n=1 Tax=Actinidia eriantha TaxID=165200 RepID=UPI00258CE7D6|nr:LOW QUALITY PROTEIN: uncharacterized protein LOC130791715 [Actinidia eriantha]
METNANTHSSLLPEIGPDGLMREAPVIAYTEKIIEAEQLQLKKYIHWRNYSKIRELRRELGNLTLEMKLTAGPKKAALELMRKKIEISTEKIRVAKLKEEEAKKAWEAASKAVKDEEAIKQKLCEDLNNLVQESSSAQFARLEELKRRLEALNPSRSSTSVPYGGQPTGPTQSNLALDASSVPSPLAPTGTESVANHGNGGNAPSRMATIISSAEGEARGKKKIPIQGRGKGIGAVPKGRGPAAPGWTGAGFDVDGRS